ncbi:MAG: hypothetical protein ACQEQV_00430 [Fibrobacterota bacterium]
MLLKSYSLHEKNQAVSDPTGIMKTVIIKIPETETGIIPINATGVIREVAVEKIPARIAVITKKAEKAIMPGTATNRRGLPIPTTGITTGRRKRTAARTE